MPEVELPALQRRVLAEVARYDQISRNELGRRLDLPKATLNTIVRNLIERGLLANARAAAAGGRGRPAAPLTLAGPPAGVGVLNWSSGELKVVVATAGGRILAESTHAISRNDLRFDAAAALLATVAGRAGYRAADLACVVLGVPAPYQRGIGAPARRDGYGYAPWLEGDPAAALAAATGVRTLVENDANLGALGEYVFGAGRDRHSLIYVKLGEHSVGAGLIINGWLHRGVTGFAGEMAHIQIDDDGPLCGCGGRGCLIQRIGPGLLTSAQPAYDHPLTYPRMLAMAADGDAGMVRILRDLGRTVGRALADTCTMLNPEVIVVDGATGTAGRHIVAGIAETVDRHAAPPAAAAVSVVPGQAHHDAEILGAVALARHEIDLSEVVR